MADIVLDASAILALLHREPGGDIVLRHAGNAIVSAVNLSEVGARLVDHGMTEEAIRLAIGSVGAEVVPFDENLAYVASLLRARTRSRGLSMGDRACLALAMATGLPALTGDRLWMTLDVGVDIRLIRGA
jgi:PIN domain nuclease of toxin-antitoxin system